MLRRCRELTSSQAAIEGTSALLRAVYGDSLPERINWRSIKLRRRQPRNADLVVFDIGRGRIKVGVVTRVSGGRVRFVHLVGGRARQGWLSLQQPNRRRLAAVGPVSNSYVRPRAPDDEKGARYLAGQLLSGFGTPPLRRF